MFLTTTQVKRIIVLFLSCISAMLVMAQQDSAQVIKAGEHTRLKFQSEYGFNDVWGHHGNFDVEAMIPLNRHFDLTTGVQFSTANVYSIHVEAQPKFIITEAHHRELYIDIDAIYRAVQRARTHDFTWALGIGYRRDYVDVEIGMFIRTMDAMQRKVDNNRNEMLVEGLAAIYALEVSCRPKESNWNLGLRMANFTEYQTEHMWNPVFSLSGRYDPVEHWRINARVYLKPAGMFSMTGSFFDVHALVGFSYTF